MPTPLRRRLRMARRSAWYTLAAVLVTMALVAGAVGQLLSLAERHPQRVADWLGARMQRTVHFDRIDTQWTRRGPLLRLDGLRIGDGADAVTIGAAEILVSQYAGLLPGSAFTELRLRGLELTLQRDDDGRWRVRGLPGDGQSRDPFAALEGLGELQVIDGKLRIDAPGLGIDARIIPEVDLRLRVDDKRVRIGVRAWMQPGVSPLQGSVEFDRDNGNGRGHLVGRQADLSVWSPLLQVAGVTIDGGIGHLEAWAELGAYRINAVTLATDLRDLQLRGAPVAGSGQAPRAGFARLQMRSRWQTVDGGWRFDAPQLRVATGANDAQTLDGLVLAGGRRYALLAQRIDAGALFAVAALSDRFEPQLRRWLLAAGPDALLHDVELAGLRDGALRAHARIEDLRFAAHGDAPGISGLGGVLDGDALGLAFAIDPAATLRIDWPEGFGRAHDVRLAGRVAGWRQGRGWRIGTSALRIAGDGYGIDLRGGITLHGDGTRPSAQLAARIDDTTVSVAKRFWLRNQMSVKLRRRLDAMLVGGRVLDGRALVSGDLDDWPFRADGAAPAKGLFRAEARLRDGVVKFLPDWPAADGIDADVDFIANGFAASGEAAIAGVAVPAFSAAIPRFDEAELTVRASTQADADKLLGLARRSPLQARHAQTLDNLAASGPATASLALDAVLHGDRGEPRIDGRVSLGGVELSEKRWNIAFDEVRGEASYNRTGFSADNLRLLHDGRPGRLALRAGAGHVRDAAQAFEAQLDVSVDADALLDRAPDMAWLKPHVAGRSPWQVALSVAKSTADADAEPTRDIRLQLRSSLVGTQLSLPAPLDKPAPTALPLRVDARLPLDNGDISVAFGRRLALRAQRDEGRTGVRVVLGSDRVTDAVPQSGLIATGRTAALDAIDWMALATGGGGQSLPLRSIDVVADSLQLPGGSFANVRVRAQPTATGTRVHIGSETLAGTLTLPDADDAAISGRFTRAYWPAPTPAEKTTGADTAAPQRDAGAAIDPATIPPLQLTVEDVRFGDLVLGAGELRTRPTPAGLRIERMRTRSPTQRIDVAGDWLGRGANARTRLQIDVRSEDFGALLTGLGFGGRLAGGEGEAQLDAVWPGSPAGFAAASLEGSLSLAMRDGRLVEVEPGAGRVLGLFSVAEIPRRLMLDFGDFFSEGFAFNRFEGSLFFEGGRARSDGIAIDGPAAEIRISGSADMRAQTFDQTIEVLPKSGNLLTVAGAIAGGPVGAAVGAVANAVLNKPLSEMGAKTYRVTGPWKDPEVEVAERDQDDFSSSASPPSG